MDDVDAVQAQIARNMLQSGDWVTARLDGIAYLEKSPLKYWMIAVSFPDFRGARLGGADPDGAGDGAAVLGDGADSGIGRSGGGAGLYAGLVLATSVGLFLFTRILIPDVILTLTITLALWGLLRALEEEERHPTWWAHGDVGGDGDGTAAEGADRGGVSRWRRGCCICSLTKQLFERRTWQRLQPFRGWLLLLADRRAVARAGDAAQSAVSRFHDAQRAGVVSRVLLVLLHQRARAAVSEPAVSAGLQHGAAAVLLAVSPAVAVSVERVFSGGVEAELPEAGPGIADAADGVVLGGIHPGVLHVFDHAGVLLDAVLSGAGAAAGLGDGERARGGCGGERKRSAVVTTLAAAAIAAILWMVRGLAAPGDIAAALTVRIRRCTRCRWDT